LIVKNVLALMVPLILTAGTFGTAWWYVTIYNAPAAATTAAASPAQGGTARGAMTQSPVEADKPQDASTSSAQGPGTAEEKPQELGAAETTVESTEPSQPLDAPPQEMGSLAEATGTSAVGKIP
jgi:hypothetical protein